MKTAATVLASALFGFVLSGCTQVAAQDATPKMVVCYYTNWSQYRQGLGTFLPNNVDPSLCTHLFFAFSKINTALNSLEPIEWNDKTVLYPGVLALKQQNPNLKLVLSVGGFNAALDGWMTASSPSNVQAFSGNVVSYLRNNNFEGLDVDWEWPDSAATGPSYVRLVQALRSAFDNEILGAGRERLKLFSAVTANSQAVAFYNPPVIAQLLDNVIIMAYDFYGTWSATLGHHSPLFLSNAEPSWSILSQHNAVEAWRQAGVPLDKMVLGVASYGRSFLISSLQNYRPGDSYTGLAPNASQFVREAGIYSYYEICSFANTSKATIQESQVPYAYGAVGGQLVWVGYDDQDSVTVKTVYALSRGMAGMMMWSLDFDDFTGTFCNAGQNYPLLRTINSIIGKTPKCSSNADCHIAGVSGQCIKGYCGCPDGSFISRQTFCTVNTPTTTTTTTTTTGDAADTTKRPLNAAPSTNNAERLRTAAFAPLVLFVFVFNGCVCLLLIK